VFINWFTVTAQIINFLVLVALLKHFLYGPIIKAMDEREARIASQLAEADKTRKEAEREAESYKGMIQELEDKHQELLAKTEKETEAHRQELRRQLRQEIEELRKRWYKLIQREKQAFFQDLHRRVSKQVIDIARQAFKDMSNLDLEQHLIGVFVQRFGEMNEAERRRIADSVKDERMIVITSAFEIPEEERQRIIQVIRQQIVDDIGVRYDISPDLIAGIELKADGYKVGWSLENYLETLEENLSGIFEEETLEQKAEKD